MRAKLFITLALAVTVCGAAYVYFSSAPSLLRIINSPSSYYSSFLDTHCTPFHISLTKNSPALAPTPEQDHEHIHPLLPIITVLTEDARFYNHIGIDFLAIARASLQNLTRAKIVSGASTIPAQLARRTLSNPRHPHRNPLTKITEFLTAVALTTLLPKSQILHAYLTTAPFGGTVTGIHAASAYYFGKSPAQLSPAEMCTLVGMLKAPSRYRPDRHPQNALNRRNQVIKLMERKHLFTPETAERARNEPLPSRVYPRPAHAWHFTQLVTRLRPHHSPTYYTTLMLPYQFQLENILEDELAHLPPSVTLCAGISDNQSGSLIAWVGNARFKDGHHWTDCGLSPRSPGSTLKPFAYLSAIEQGLVTPSQLIADTNAMFGGNAPRNFDQMYRGAVTVRTALHESLNAPAVRILRTAGRSRVLSYLRDFGYNHLTHGAEYYGNSLILGGCEVTLFEQLEAYTALASLGKHRTLRLLSEDRPHTEQIASRAGCWMVSEMLRYDGELTGGLTMALKTGTSYGLRDSWACAWTPKYTVCVWCGNPDGSSWEGLVGARTSAPIAVRIMRSLPRSEWYKRPEGITARKVCALSGKPPSAMCPSTKTDWAVSGVSQSLPCDIHGPKGTVSMPGEFGVNMRKDTPFSITSPIPGASYFTAPFDSRRKIPLKSEGSKGKIWWYVDGEYVGMSEAGQAFFQSIDDGTHTVSAADESGRTDAVTVKVFTPGRNTQAESLF